MAEQKCKKCGHDRDAHKDNWGGICIGCPCPGYEPATPSGEVAQEEGGMLFIAHKYNPMPNSRMCAECSYREGDPIHAAQPGCLCDEYGKDLCSLHKQAQPEPQPAGTEKTAWQAIIKWAYENTPDAVVAINQLASEVVKARDLKQSHTQCVEALKALVYGEENGSRGHAWDVAEASLDIARALESK